MKSKKSVGFGIGILVLLIFGLISTLLPYVVVNKKDVQEAVKTVFKDMEGLMGPIEDSGGDGWQQKLTGIQVIKKLSQLDLGQDMNYVNQVKTFIIAGLLIAWLLCLIALICSLVLKQKAKYITVMVLTIISLLVMVFTNIHLPKVAKNAVVVGVEAKESIDDTEAVADTGESQAMDIITGESLRDVVTSWVEQLAREILDRGLGVGYFLWIGIMATASILCILGLVFDRGSVRTFVTVLSGDYKGASIEVDTSIMVGRDPRVCQLVMDENQISRKHCKISYNYNTGRYLVTDHSSNGTYYDEGRKMDENVVTELKAGTVITLGKDGVRLKLG